MNPVRIIRDLLFRAMRARGQEVNEDTVDFTSILNAEAFLEENVDESGVREKTE